MDVVLVSQTGGLSLDQLDICGHVYLTPYDSDLET
jgi:hypothetical protein